MIIVLVASAGVKGALLGPVGFIVALFVGTVSFFSPCILPLLPGYLSFVSGLSGEEAEQTRAARRRTLLGIGLFVLGYWTSLPGAQIPIFTQTGSFNLPA